MTQSVSITIVLLCVSLVADDSTSASAEGTTESCAFKCATRLMAYNATESRSAKTADNGTLLSIRTGGSLAVGETKGHNC